MMDWKMCSLSNMAILHTFWKIHMELHGTLKITTVSKGTSSSKPSFSGSMFILPSWELRYPIKIHFWKFLFLFPRWDMYPSPGGYWVYLCQYISRGVAVASMKVRGGGVGPSPRWNPQGSTHLATIARGRWTRWLLYREFQQGTRDPGK